MRIGQEVMETFNILLVFHEDSYWRTSARTYTSSRSIATSHGICLMILKRFQGVPTATSGEKRIGHPNGTQFLNSWNTRDISFGFRVARGNLICYSVYERIGMISRQDLSTMQLYFHLFIPAPTAPSRIMKT